METNETGDRDRYVRCRENNRIEDAGGCRIFLRDKDAVPGKIVKYLDVIVDG